MIDRTQTVGKQAKESPGNSPMFKTKRKPNCTPTGAEDGEETFPHFFSVWSQTAGKKSLCVCFKTYTSLVYEANLN